MEGDNEADRGLNGLSEDQLQLVDLLISILRTQGTNKNINDLALAVIEFADFFQSCPLFIFELEILAGVREDIRIADNKTYKAA